MVMRVPTRRADYDNNNSVFAATIRNINEYRADLVYYRYWSRNPPEHKFIDAPMYRLAKGHEPFNERG